MPPAQAPKYLTVEVTYDEDPPTQDPKYRTVEVTYEDEDEETDYPNMLSYWLTEQNNRILRAIDKQIQIIKKGDAERGRRPMSANREASHREILGDFATGHAYDIHWKKDGTFTRGKPKPVPEWATRLSRRAAGVVDQVEHQKSKMCDNKGLSSDLARSDEGSEGSDGGVRL